MSRACSSFSLASRGLFIKNTSSPRTLETTELAVGPPQRTVSHFPFTREFLTEDNRTVVPHPPYCSVSRLKTKLRGRHFDTTEVMEAVLNSLRERAGRGDYFEGGGQ
jgi:hypothetical protein